MAEIGAVWSVMTAGHQLGLAQSPGEVVECRGSWTKA
jgi:hypothetical protein